MLSGGGFAIADKIDKLRNHEGPIFIVEYDESCETLCAKVMFENKDFAMTREEYTRWEAENLSP
jgi:hypothetical protein